MTAQWVKYDGSDEQVTDIKAADHGYILKNDVGHISKISYNLETNGLRNGTSKRLMFNCSEVSHYLICAPHPYADMICQWTRTGQPVYYRAIECKTFTGECLNDEFNLYPFAHPDKYEYSFTPFEEEV